MKTGTCVADYARGRVKVKYIIKWDDDDKVATHNKEALKQGIMRGIIAVRNLKIQAGDALVEIDPDKKIVHYQLANDDGAEDILDRLRTCIVWENMQYEVVKNTVEIKFNNGKIDHKAVFTGSNKGLKVEIQIVTESDTRVMTLTAEKTDMIACRMLVRSVINILKEYGRPITRV